MPSSLQAQITRRAISPRLAIRIFLNIGGAAKPNYTYRILSFRAQRGICFSHFERLTPISRQVLPGWISTFDKSNLLRPRLGLHAHFARNRIIHVLEYLKVNQSIHLVAFREGLVAGEEGCSYRTC